MRVGRSERASERVSQREAARNECAVQREREEGRGERKRIIVFDVMAYREERIGEDFTLEQHGAAPCSRGDAKLGRGAGSRGSLDEAAPAAEVALAPSLRGEVER